MTRPPDGARADCLAAANCLHPGRPANARCEGCTADEFGARFLAELQRLGIGRGNWNYETVMAMETADRARFVEQFRRASPKAPYALIQLALSAEPEVLARRLVESQPSDGILPLFMLSF